MHLEFGFDGCPLDITEKRFQLKELRDKDANIVSIILFPEIFKVAQRWPGMAVQLGLYTCKCYYGLLLFWKLRDKKN